MEKGISKELIKEIEKLEVLSIEKINELEFFNNTTCQYIKSLFLEINLIKKETGKSHLNVELINLIIEEKLVWAISDYQLYLEQQELLSLDDEMYEEINKELELINSKIKTYQKILGYDSSLISFSNKKL
ncbi:MAG: hypothetical protein PHF21_05165 [Bacilli bacterium]|nr:hypothetical protein [Bacilli bacterium]